MDTAEVTPIRSRDNRRLWRATALLLSGMATHAWLFPSTRPGMLETLAGRLERLGDERVVATTGTAVPTSVASSLGALAASDESTARPRKSNRVKVVVETIHPALARPLIESTPMRPLGAVTLAAVALAQHEFPGGQEPAAADLDALDSAPEPATPPAPDVTTAGVPDRPEPGVLEALEGLPQAAATLQRAEHPVVAAVHYQVSQQPRPDGPSDERLVSHVLQQYREAYGSLDVTAAQNVWPTVDARALNAAFRQLAGQRVTFDSCGVRVSGSGAQATARCKGQAEYVPKVGGRRAVVASGEWIFDLAKEDSAWRIISANAMVK